ncbi:MAG TPA: competence/damage-inducible protein A [Saprospiraceae bacterium]|nr:competence/damage-inducible protein A [Saprospiraceae bacterium]
MDVSIITIGDEILIGQVVDTNSAWMAQQLNLNAFSVVEIKTISDDNNAIIASLDSSLKSTDIVLLTGGLGPTKDDITKKALADYFGVEMIFSEETYQRIIRIFERWGQKPNEVTKEQCFMPANATLLKNKMGTAPGMWFEHEEKVIVSMPGVPYEMKYLMENEVLPKLKKHFPGKPFIHRTILTVGEGESRLATRIEAFENNLPENIKLAYLPNLGKVKLRLSGKADNASLLNKVLDAKVEELNAIIPEFIFGYEDEELESAIGKLLIEKGKTLGTAESCTGGYLAHKITSIPGSSAYFKGSVIAYANAIKHELLKVSNTTLDVHGAVSEQTVIEMVKGALDLLKTDIAISISGIAGPGGGTPEKPVGTIWMAIGNHSIIKTQKLQLGKDRLKNIEFTTVQALNMIRKFLISSKLA